jgi:3-oxoacyl-[acyl-carrier protein] reductase
MANSGSLVGKVALITGGSRGIGAAIVRRLAKEGATVAFTYSSSPEKAESLQATIETAGGRALAIKADSAAKLIHPSDLLAKLGVRNII